MAITSAPRRGTHAGLESGRAIGIFAVVVALWLAFRAVLIADPGRLADLWVAIQGLWLPVRAIVWLVFLPWLGALWIWQWPWPVALRLILMSGLGLATIVAFYPRRKAEAAPAAVR